MNTWHKIGNLMEKKDGNGSYISLGTTKSKYKPYKIVVSVIDETDECIYQVENPALTIRDPRNNPHLKPGQAEKIPSFILGDIFVVEKDE